MVTGHGDEAIAVEAMKRGASDYVVKDIDGHYLRLLPAVVARALHQYQLTMQKAQAEAALQETLATLETRVQQRTVELQEANVRLRAEIQERRQAEEALARLYRQYQLILEAAGEGIYGLDSEGRTTFVNPAAAQMLGWPAEDLVGRVMHDCIHHTHADGAPWPRETCALHKALHTGSIVHLPEDHLWRKDGSHFLVESMCAPLREHDEVVGAVVLFRDITAQQQTRQEMQRTDRLALVGQLTSGLAHEIGTPLNIIAGNAEFLAMQLRDHGLEMAELQAIIEQAERITRLIERLLTFAGAKDEPLAPIALHESLDYVLRLLGTRFQREAITVTVDVPADLPAIWGAPDLLAQVWLNVFVNAWHAMPQGGTLHITAQALPPHNVQVVMRDTGVGMDQTTLAHAFEPFYSTKGTKGTGLGLAICHQIIDQHGGAIRLESAPGQGTTVIITLIRADAGSGLAATPPHPPSHADASCASSA
jgi:PAS domain S-box-containing protein